VKFADRIDDTSRRTVHRFEFKFRPMVTRSSFTTLIELPTGLSNTHVKPFGVRARLFLFSLALLFAGFLMMRAFLSPAILYSHTLFAFSQLDDAYRDSIESGHPRATSRQEFINLVPQWTIDWNSCRFRDQTIFDSWGTPTEVRSNSSTIELRSAGPDRAFETRDDIRRQISNASGA
jgi:hypothetical protein